MCLGKFLHNPRWQLILAISWQTRRLSSRSVVSIGWKMSSSIMDVTSLLNLLYWADSSFYTWLSRSPITPERTEQVELFMSMDSIWTYSYIVVCDNTQYLKISDYDTYKGRISLFKLIRPFSNLLLCSTVAWYWAKLTFIDDIRMPKR